MYCPQCARDVEPVHGCCPHHSTPVALSAEESQHLGALVAGRWHLDRVLGQGGFATVYAGIDSATGQPCAVKVLHTAQAKDPDLVARFQNELEILATLHHPCVVGLLGGGCDAAAGWYIAMPRLGDRDLAVHLAAEGPLAPPLLKRVVHDVLSALAYLHELGIVHRDVKTENVVLAMRGAELDRAVLLDFGVAKPQGAVAAPSPGHGLTRPRQVIGSAWTMAPEQVLSDPVDGRTDLYSFGVLLFELLTGQLPFVASRVGLVMRAHVHEPPPPPSQCGSGHWIPPSLDKLVLELLAKTREERPPSAAAVWQRCLALWPEVEVAWRHRAPEP